MLETIRVPETYLEPMRSNPTVGTFALAYLATKITEPLRLVTTIAITPRIYRWVKNRKDANDGDDDHFSDNDSDDEEVGKHRQAAKHH